MSIALEAKVVALEKRVAELEQQLAGGKSIVSWAEINPVEFLSNVAQLEMRLERIEQASAKPQGRRNG